ncbi:Helix-turn-helix domain protein [compost metagenome]
MARIARFHAVVAATAGAGSVDWADLAARFGYADQPHLVREFRRLSGVSPTQFLARRTPDEQHVIVT